MFTIDKMYFFQGKISQIFKSFDPDNTGEITKAHFIDICHRFGMSEKHLGFGGFFDLMDIDGGGTIDFEEFEEAIQGKFVILFTSKFG